MPLPRIAIVGRPNVGKSSLMNMIAGAKVSIVDPTPGVTRDRVSAIVDLEPPDRSGVVKPVEFTDTGGFGAYFEASARFDEIGNDLRRLTKDIESQIAQAVAGADVILFCVDAQAGITAADREIARLLREQKLGARSREGGRLVPVRVVATKVDGPRWEMHAHEISALGFGEPLMCSAKNNYMRRDLIDAVWEMMPERDRAMDEKYAAQRADIKIAIIGKRNAGKSTLVNTVAGEPRVIVSEIPGTTRDAIDVRVERNGRSMVIVDTAGLRRKKSFQGPVEWYAFDRLQKAVDRSDVVVLLIDATTRLSQVDEQCAMIAQKAFKPVIIAINKWDLAEGQPGRTGRPVTTDDFETYIRKELKGLDFAPISFMSAAEGMNVRQTMDLAFDLAQQSALRIGTGKLNRLFRKIVELRGPPSKTGQVAKVYYVAQTGTSPPTITLVVNFPELFTSTYQRFLVNRLRENTDLVEVPIKLNIRDRTRTPQGERGQSPDAVEEAMGAAGAEDLLREDSLLGMRAAARKAARLGDAEDAASYFDDAPPPRAGKPAAPVPKGADEEDDDLDEARLAKALAELDANAHIEPVDDGSWDDDDNTPIASRRDDDDQDDEDADDTATTSTNTVTDNRAARGPSRAPASKPSGRAQNSASKPPARGTPGTRAPKPAPAKAKAARTRPAKSGSIARSPSQSKPAKGSGAKSGTAKGPRVTTSSAKTPAAKKATAKPTPAKSRATSANRASPKTAPVRASKPAAKGKGKTTRPSASRRAR